MSETPPFTAQDVRDEATHFGTRVFYADRIRAMLDAFAQRLEQEEQHRGDVVFMAPAQVEVWRSPLELIEEGRREILCEIAAMHMPVYFEGYDANVQGCAFCGDERPFNTSASLAEQQIKHKPDCLFLRAQQARQTPETP